MAEKIIANTLLRSAAFRAGGIRRLKAAIRNAQDAKVVYQGVTLGTPAQLFAKKADRASREEINAVRCMERLVYLGISLKAIDGQELIPTYKNLVAQELHKMRTEEIQRRAEKRQYRKQSSYWDRMTKKLISLSSDEVKASQSYEAAKAEWELHPDREQRLDPWYRRKKGCELCSKKDIRWGYVLKNKKTGKEIRVGSECVANHSIPRGEEQRAEYLVALAKQRKVVEGSLKVLKTSRKHSAIKLLASMDREIAKVRSQLAAIQEIEAEELKASRIRAIRAANERYLREKNIPRLQESLETLHKYRGILSLIDPKGPTLVSKEIENLRDAMSTIRGLREDAVYFHDTDVAVIRELYKILLQDCSVLARYPDFEMKMRGLWNHRSARIDGKNIFSAQEIALIERMHELWRRDITETDLKDPEIIKRHFRIPIKEADALMALHQRIKDKGLLTTEDVLLMDPYFKSKIARLKREIHRFSREDRELIRRVYNSFGRSTFTYTEISPIIQIEQQVRTRSQLSQEEVRSFLMLERRARLEDENRQRFIRNLRDIYDRDGLFFPGDILTILELARERERRRSKSEVRQEIVDIDKEVDALYKWSKLLPKEESYIAAIYNDWKDLAKSDIAQIDVRRIEELYRHLSAPMTLHQLSKIHPEFENLLRIRRAVLRASELRAAREILEPASIRALEFLTRQTAGDLQRLDIGDAETVLPLLEEIARKFVPSDHIISSEPSLAAKAHDILANRYEWGRFIDGKSIERMSVLWHMGYFDRSWSQTVNNAVLNAAEAQRLQMERSASFLCESHRQLAAKMDKALADPKGHVARQEIIDLQRLRDGDWRIQVKYLCKDLKDHAFRQDIYNNALMKLVGIIRSLKGSDVHEVVVTIINSSGEMDRDSHYTFQVLIALAPFVDRAAINEIVKAFRARPSHVQSVEGLLKVLQTYAGDAEIVNDTSRILTGEYFISTAGTAKKLTEVLPNVALNRNNIKSGLSAKVINMLRQGYEKPNKDLDRTQCAEVLGSIASATREKGMLQEIIEFLLSKAPEANALGAVGQAVRNPLMDEADLNEAGNHMLRLLEQCGSSFDRSAILPVLRYIGERVNNEAMLKAAQESPQDKEAKELIEFQWGYPTPIQDRKNAVISWKDKIMNSHDPVVEQRGINELLKALGDWFYWEKQGRVIWAVQDEAMDAFIAIAQLKRLREKVFNGFKTCTDYKGRYGVTRILESMSKVGGEISVMAKVMLDSIEQELKTKAEIASGIDFNNTEIEWRKRFENVSRWGNIVISTTDNQLAEKGTAEIVKAYKKGEAVGTEAAKWLKILVHTRWGLIAMRYSEIRPEMELDD
jgi:hypothetical protein